MPKFKVNIEGQNYSIDAASSDDLPEIVESISREQKAIIAPVTSIKSASPGQFIGQITNPPSIIERAKRAIPSAAQFIGGLGGGAIASRIGKPVLGSAIGGTLGRTAGEVARYGIEQLERDPSGFLSKSSLIGPIATTIQGMTDSERKRIGREFMKTAGTEAIAGIGGTAFTAGASTITNAIGKALIGDRAFQRGLDVGFDRILNPKFFKNRVAKDVAIKANNFFDRLKSHTGKKVADAIKKKGVGDIPAPVNTIKGEILGIESKLGSIDDFGPEVSPAQRKAIRKLQDDFLNMSDNTTIEDLWEMRKDFDKTRFNMSFKDEARKYLDEMRKIVSRPIRESSDEVAESFGRYSFVMDQEDRLGKTFSADVERGARGKIKEVFNPELETFISNLQTSKKDEMTRLLRKLDSYASADDKFIEDLLDASAAEVLEGQGGGATIAGRIAAELSGGRRKIAEVAAMAQSPQARTIRRLSGRAIPTAASEIISEDEI